MIKKGESSGVQVLRAISLLGVIAVTLYFVGTQTAEAVILYENDATPITNAYGGDFPFTVATNTVEISAIAFYLGASSDVNVQWTLSEVSEANHVDCTTGSVTVSSIGGTSTSTNPSDLAYVVVPVTGTECYLNGDTWGFDMHVGTAASAVGGNSGFSPVRYLEIRGGFDIDLQGEYDVYNYQSDTRFTKINLSGGTNLTIGAQYFLASDEVNVNYSNTNPTFIKYSISLNPSTTTISEYVAINPLITATSSATTTFSGLADGTYDLLVRFSNTGCNLNLSPCPFPASYYYSTLVISGGSLTTSTSEYYDTTSFEIEQRYQECSLTAFTGCITNAFIFLFIPGEFSTFVFNEAITSIWEQYPFSIVNDAKNEAQALESTASSESTLSINMGSTSIPLSLVVIDRETTEQVLTSGAVATFREIAGYAIWSIAIISMIVTMIWLMGRTRV